jgi:hypothetical protein
MRPALGIASWLGSNGTCGASVHDIIMFFMDLHMLAEFCLDMFVVVNFYASNQFSGINIARHHP